MSLGDAVLSLTFLSAIPVTFLLSPRFKERDDDSVTRMLKRGYRHYAE
jgi:hypothetical protein